MKNLIIFILIVFLSAGAVFAQGIREPQQSGDSATGQRPRRSEQQTSPQRRSEQNETIERRLRIEPVTVNGTLKLEKGFVAVESGETVYLVPMLNRYIGFIKDLSEGANVTVEGNVFKNMMWLTKLTLGEKTYDFPAFGSGFALGSRWGEQRDQERAEKFEGREKRERVEQGRDNRLGREKNFRPGRNGFGPCHGQVPDRWGRRR